MINFNSLFASAKLILTLIDLTTLNDNDTPDKIIDLCAKAATPFGHVAAICINSRFIPLAKKHLPPQIKIASTTNFPHGTNDVELMLLETKLALDRGADEIDMVFPYHALVAGNSQIGVQMVAQAKAACGHQASLKVILESGMLPSTALIQQAAKISIDNGADFIKTSTGKVAVNATLDAAEVMLTTIKDTGNTCGFKASGGIRTVEEASKYLALHTKIMGDTVINPNNFRFGASVLLDNVIEILSNRPNNSSLTT